MVAVALRRTHTLYEMQSNITVDSCILAAQSCFGRWTPRRPHADYKVEAGREAGHLDKASPVGRKLREHWRKECARQQDWEMMLTSQRTKNY